MDDFFSCRSCAIFDQPIKLYISDLFEKFKLLGITVNAQGARMTAEGEKEPCCMPRGMSCCRVESIVSIDERGQMILPKDLRERAKIRGGDKIAVVSMEMDGKICCLSLIKVEELETMVRSVLGPVMDEVFKK